MGSTIAGCAAKGNAKIKKEMAGNNRAAFLAGLTAAISYADGAFMLPTKNYSHIPKLSGKEKAKAKGLTAFEVKEGVTIYARNESEAIKRARKRGLI